MDDTLDMPVSTDSVDDDNSYANNWDKEMIEYDDKNGDE